MTEVGICRLNSPSINTASSCSRTGSRAFGEEEEDSRWVWELVLAPPDVGTNADATDMPHHVERLHTLRNLAAGAAYEVVVRVNRGVGGGVDGGGGGERRKVSDPERFRTSATGATHTTAYRISEYTFDVDFLENHDAASPLAMPVYVCVPGFAPSLPVILLVHEAWWEGAHTRPHGSLCTSQSCLSGAAAVGVC